MSCHLSQLKLTLNFLPIPLNPISGKALCAVMLASTLVEMKQPEAEETLSFMIAGTHGDIAPPLLSAGGGKGLRMMFSAGLSLSAIKEKVH